MSIDQYRSTPQFEFAVRLLFIQYSPIKSLPVMSSARAYVNNFSR